MGSTRNKRFQATVVKTKNLDPISKMMDEMRMGGMGE